MDTSATVADLREYVQARLPAPAWDWLVGSLARIADDPADCPVRYASAARRCGKGPLNLNPNTTGWRLDEAVRVLLLHAVPTERRLAVTSDVYSHGDPAERRAALKALDLLAIGADGLWLVEDAIRTNDRTLIQAALGPYAARHLTQPALRQAILKAAFHSVPFVAIPEVLGRADDELVGMLIDFVRERIVAGRDVDSQILDVIATRPRQLAAANLDAEVNSPVPFRAAAARQVADQLTAASRRAAVDHSH